MCITHWQYINHFNASIETITLTVDPSVGDLMNIDTTSEFRTKGPDQHTSLFRRMVVHVVHAVQPQDWFMLVNHAFFHVSMTPEQFPFFPSVVIFDGCFVG